MMVVMLMTMMVIMMMSVMIMIVTMKMEVIKWGMRILLIPLMPKGDVEGRVRYSEDVIMYVTANGDHYGLIMMAVMTWPI